MLADLGVVAAALTPVLGGAGTDQNDRPRRDVDGTVKLLPAGLRERDRTDRRAG